MKWWTLLLLCALTSLATSDDTSLKDNPAVQRILRLGAVSHLPGVLGEICAYGDFNSDRYTDVVTYKKNNLTVYFASRTGQQFSTKGATDGYADLDITLDIGEHDKVECAIGDVTGDGLHDIVVSTKSVNDDKGHWNVVVFVRLAQESSTFEKVLAFEAKHQVATIDVSGDGVHDILGLHPNGSLLCIMGIDGNNLLRTTHSCESYFPDTFSLDWHPHIPILFGDVTNDDHHLADIVLPVKQDGKVILKVWTRSHNNNDWHVLDALPLYKDADFEHILSPMMTDFDLDGKIELLVPICTDKTCTRLREFALIQYQARWMPWQTCAVSMNASYTIIDDADTLVRMKVADYDLDGYPDLVAVVGDETGGSNQAIILKNKLGDQNKSFVEQDMKLIHPPDSLGQAQRAYFYDFNEDGYIDILLEHHKGKEKGWNIIINENTLTNDVTFLKIQTYLPLPSGGDIKDGRGVAWGGACTRYEMDTPLAITSGTRVSIDCLLAQGISHKAGIHPSFSLFGLGRNPNFVDKVNMYVPRVPWEEQTCRHEKTQLVPNSRLMVQPPRAHETYWVLRLYVTPSSLIYSSLLVMASTCTLLLIVVLILHFREKKVDRVERQAQSHRFHFDAM